ncbi:hypothetical protein COY27_05280 [Candidatus Woesearchaeota archaeon CG_4_10_14_0_2_um_filter_33_13]|nr:MAG: hypothetical protein COY27_05280 [Candidatus Woesearchaeota archaeon CG_4_10_14_0_2_um_filter_33_13]
MHDSYKVFRYWKKWEGLPKLPEFVLIDTPIYEGNDLNEASRIAKEHVQNSRSDERAKVFGITNSGENITIHHTTYFRDRGSQPMYSNQGVPPGTGEVVSKRESISLPILILEDLVKLSSD